MGGEGQHFPLFGPRIEEWSCQPKFLEKMGRIFPLPPKKLRPTVLEDVVPGVMMQIFAPALTPPLPAPIQGTGLLGPLSVRRSFFGAPEKREEGGPYNASIFPAPSPPPHSSVQYAPGATWTVWGEEKGGGGQVRGTDAHPAEPLLYSQPSSAFPLLRQCKRLKVQEWFAWGWRLGGLSSPLTQSSPPPSQEPPPPPRNVRADGGRNAWEGGGYGGVNGQPLAEQARLTLLSTPLPPGPLPPPACTLLPHAEVRCRITQAGRGSGCPP